MPAGAPEKAQLVDAWNILRSHRRRDRKHRDFLIPFLHFAEHGANLHLLKVGLCFETFPSFMNCDDDHNLCVLSCILVDHEIELPVKSGEGDEVVVVESDQDIRHVRNGPYPVLVEPQTDLLGDGLKVGEHDNVIAEVHQHFNLRAAPDWLDVEHCFRLQSVVLELKGVDIELPERLELDVADMGSLAVACLPPDLVMVTI